MADNSLTGQDVSVEIGADLSGLRKDLDKMDGLFNGLSNNLSKSFTKMTSSINQVKATMGGVSNQISTTNSKLTSMAKTSDTGFKSMVKSANSTTGAVNNVDKNITKLTQSVTALQTAFSKDSAMSGKLFTSMNQQLALMTKQLANINSTSVQGFDKIRKGLGAVVSESSKATKGIKGLNSEFGESPKSGISSELKKTNDQHGRMEDVFRKYFMLPESLRNAAKGFAAVSFQIFIFRQGLQQALDLWKMLFGGALEVFKDSEVKTASMTGILMAQTTLNGEVLKYNDALALSAKMLKAVKKEAFNTMFKGDDLEDMLNRISPKAFQKGMTSDQITKLVGATAKAAGAFGQSPEQAAEDMIKGMSGQIRPASNKLMTALGIDKNMIKEWDKAGTLFDNLINKLASVEEAGNLANKSMTGLMNRLVDGLVRTQEEGFGDFFEGMKRDIDKLQGLFYNKKETRTEIENPDTGKKEGKSFVEYELNPTTIKVWEAFGAVMGNVQHVLTDTIMFIVQLMGVLAPLLNYIIEFSSGFGEGFVGTMTLVSEGLALLISWLSKIGSYFGLVDGGVRNLSKVVGWLSGAFAAFLVVGGATFALLKLLSAAKLIYSGLVALTSVRMVLWNTVINGTNVALGVLRVNVLAIVAPLALLGASFYGLMKLTNDGGNLFDGLVKGGESFIAWFRGLPKTFQVILNACLIGFAPLILAFKAIGIGGKDAAESLVMIFYALADVLATVFATIVAICRGDMDTVYQIWGSIWYGMLAKLKIIGNNMLLFIINLVNSMGKAFADFLRKFTGIVPAFGAVADAIEEKVSSAFSGKILEIDVENRELEESISNMTKLRKEVVNTQVSLANTKIKSLLPTAGKTTEEEGGGTATGTRSGDTADKNKSSKDNAAKKAIKEAEAELKMFMEAIKIMQDEVADRFAAGKIGLSQFYNEQFRLANEIYQKEVQTLQVKMKYAKDEEERETIGHELRLKELQFVKQRYDLEKQKLEEIKTMRKEILGLHIENLEASGRLVESGAKSFVDQYQVEYSKAQQSIIYLTSLTTALTEAQKIELDLAKEYVGLLEEKYNKQLLLNKLKEIEFRIGVEQTKLEIRQQKERIKLLTGSSTVLQNEREERKLAKENLELREKELKSIYATKALVGESKEAQLAYNKALAQGLSSYADALDRVKDKVSAVSKAISTSLKDSISGMLKGETSWADAISNLFSSISNTLIDQFSQTLTDNIMGLFDGTKGKDKTLDDPASSGFDVSLEENVNSAQASLSTAMNASTTDLTNLNSAFLTTTTVLLEAAEKIRATYTAVGESMNASGEVMASTMANTAQKLDTAGTEIINNLSQITSSIMDTISAAGSNMSEATNESASMSSFISGTMSAAGESFNEATEDASGGLSGLGNVSGSLMGLFSGMFGKLDGLFSGLFGKLGGLFEGLFGGGGSGGGKSSGLISLFGGISGGSGGDAKGAGYSWSAFGKQAGQWGAGLSMQVLGSMFSTYQNNKKIDKERAKFWSNLDKEDKEKQKKLGVWDFKGLLGFSQGGLVDGAGTGTSDSVLARVSNGEYVMRASAVNSFGTDFFSALNAGRMPLSYPQAGGKGSSGETYSDSRQAVFNNTFNVKSLEAGEAAAMIEKILLPKTERQMEQALKKSPTMRRRVKEVLYSGG